MAPNGGDRRRRVSIGNRYDKVMESKHRNLPKNHKRMILPCKKYEDLFIVVTFVVSLVVVEWFVV